MRLTLDWAYSARGPVREEFNIGNLGISRYRRGTAVRPVT